MKINSHSESEAKSIAKRHSLSFISAFERHQQEPTITPGSYLRRMNLALGQKTSSLNHIYLDTKFWLLLRDVQMGKTQDPELETLLNILVKTVSSKKLICPASDIILSELLKQSDPNTRLATVRLIDRLSKGITVLSLHERLGAEVFHWVRSNKNHVSSLHPIEHLIWTRIPNLLGSFFPEQPEIDAATQAAIQKAWIETFAKLSLEDVILSIPQDAFSRLAPVPPLHESLNKGKFQNQITGSDFKTLYFDEVRGGIDAHWHLIEDVFKTLYYVDIGEKPKESLSESTKRETIALLMAVFQTDKIGTHLPSLRIIAGINAAIRVDEKRKYKMGDWHDMLHASIALPYCDAFFTDRSFSSLLKNAPLSYGKLYSTTVLWDVKDAISYVQNL